ncbi:hypothetical protein [Streptomyces griseofuscus]|uniref:hypothetical protein n=1 Tax=Streptomyces griseofuscus TaxID=146922 RepID=UPI0037F5EB6B
MLHEHITYDAPHSTGTLEGGPHPHRRGRDERRREEYLRDAEEPERARIAADLEFAEGKSATAAPVAPTPA